MEIHPTGTCFDDALRYVAELVMKHGYTKKNVRKNFRVVHGICLFLDGRPYAHAWVEKPKDNSVFFCGIVDGEPKYFKADKAYYYEQFKVQECTRYNIQEVIANGLRDDSAPGGPWIEKYKALTIEGRKQTA